MNSLTLTPRLEKIAEFTHQRLYEMAGQHPDPQHHPNYRWQHTLRVTRYGQQLVEAGQGNLEIVLAACLLHDVAHFDPMSNYKDHGRLGAQISRPLLVELGYPMAVIDAICYAIAVHVDGDAGFEHSATLEAGLVSDADNIDRFGAYRTLAFCCPDLNDFPALAGKLVKRLETLRRYQLQNPMETAAGKSLFARQLERQVAFYEALLVEWEMSQE